MKKCSNLLREFYLFYSVTMIVVYSELAPYSFFDCCDGTKSLACQRKCGYDVDFGKWFRTNPLGMNGCRKVFPTYMRCGNGGRNNLQCCKDIGVDPDCWIFCRVGDDTDPSEMKMPVPKGIKCVNKNSAKVWECMRNNIPVLPAPPTNVRTDKIGVNWVTIIWNDVPDHSPKATAGFLVEYKRTNDGEGSWEKERRDDPDIFSHTFYNLDIGSSYHVRVSSVNNIGESLPSKRISFNLLPASCGSLPSGEYVAIHNRKQVDITINGNSVSYQSTDNTGFNWQGQCIQEDIETVPGGTNKIYIFVIKQSDCFRCFLLLPVETTGDFSNVVLARQGQCVAPTDFDIINFTPYCAEKTRLIVPQMLFSPVGEKTQCLDVLPVQSNFAYTNQLPDTCANENNIIFKNQTTNSVHIVFKPCDDATPKLDKRLDLNCLAGADKTGVAPFLDLMDNSHLIVFKDQNGQDPIFKYRCGIIGQPAPNRILFLFSDSADCILDLRLNQNFIVIVIAITPGPKESTTQIPLTTGSITTFLSTSFTGDVTTTGKITTTGEIATTREITATGEITTTEKQPSTAVIKTAEPFTSEAPTTAPRKSPPPAPINFEVEILEIDSVRLTWDIALTNLTNVTQHLEEIYYEVHHVLEDTDTDWDIAKATNKSIIVLGLIPGGTYLFKVRAVNKAGAGPFSQIVNETLLDSDCKIPSIFWGGWYSYFKGQDHDIFIYSNVYAVKSKTYEWSGFCIKSTTDVDADKADIIGTAAVFKRDDDTYCCVVFNPFDSDSIVVNTITCQPRNNFRISSCDKTSLTMTMTMMGSHSHSQLLLKLPMRLASCNNFLSQQLKFRYVFSNQSQYCTNKGNLVKPDEKLKPYGLVFIFKKCKKLSWSSSSKFFVNCVGYRLLEQDGLDSTKIVLVADTDTKIDFKKYRCIKTVYRKNDINEMVISESTDCFGDIYSRQTLTLKTDLNGRT